MRQRACPWQEHAVSRAESGARRPLPALTSRWRRCQLPQQCRQDRPLPFQDLAVCHIGREPCGTIDLGKWAVATRARRPFHAEGIAEESRRIKATFDGPHGDDFGTRLAKGAERQHLAFGPAAGLFLELALGRGERILARQIATFGDGPGAVVFFGPKGPARMHQQNLDLRTPAPIEQNACALLRHASAEAVQRRPVKPGLSAALAAAGLAGAPAGGQGRQQGTAPSLAGRLRSCYSAASRLPLTLLRRPSSSFRYCPV